MSTYGESLWGTGEAVSAKCSMGRPGVGTDSWVLLYHIYILSFTH